MAGRRTARTMAARVKEMMMEYAYLITLGAVIAVVAATALYTSRMRAESAGQVQAAAGAPEVEVRQTLPPAPAVRHTPLPTIAPLSVRPVTLTLGAGKVWPVSGEIVRGDSANRPVLWKALGSYQIHCGVDVQGTRGEPVLCVMDGVIERVTRDDLWGWQVCVAQTDGSTLRYAGLGTCALAEGQSVTRGQQLGMLGDVPCEKELGAHLHLELTQDGAAADVASFLEHAKRP